MVMQNFRGKVKQSVLWAMRRRRRCEYPRIVTETK